MASSLLVLLPFTSSAESESPQSHAIAVVVTQAVGVGALADRLADLAADELVEQGLEVIRPGDAARQLREAGAPDPLTCGTDPRCLRSLAEALGARGLVAVGLGRFAGMYGLDLRSVERLPGGEEAPKTSSGTWAEPGPDWEVAIREAVRTVAPASVGWLFVHTDEAGAEIRVNGEPRGLSPLAEALELPPGTHQVEILQVGRGGVAREVELAVGQTLELSLDLGPVAGSSRPAWIAPAKWTTGAVALAALTGAVATHLSASQTMDDARADKAAGRQFSAKRQDALDTLTTARILYGVAAAAGVGSGILFWLDAGAPQSMEPLPTP